MKALLLVVALLGQLATVTTTAPQDEAIRRPLSATAELFRPTSADAPPIRIDLPRRGGDMMRSPYRIDDRIFRADRLVAELAVERARRKDSAPVSALRLIVQADRLAATGDLLELYRACARPELAIWQISLAVAPRASDPAHAERLLPLFIPVDAGLAGETRGDATTRGFTPNEETWLAALRALPRGTALDYVFDGASLPPERFAAAILDYKGGGEPGAIRLELPGRLPVGDLVLLMDLLRASGFRSGGTAGAAIEVHLSDPGRIAIGDRDELRIVAARAPASLALEEAVEDEVVIEEEPVEDEVISDEDVHDEEVVQEERLEDMRRAVTPDDFTGRRGGRKRARRGDGRREQVAVDRGLAWLAAHQSPDGSWDSDGFMERDRDELGPPCDGKGQATYDVAGTGLALLCFLGAGETHKAGEYKRTVAQGLKWLRDQQDEDGCFGSRKVANFTYNHAIGTLAMTEAYGLTRSPLFKAYAKRGLDFALACQNPYKAWRYGKADGQNDSSVTGWMVMALKSGQTAGFEIDPMRFAWALDWIEEMTDEESGRTGYIRRGEPPVREVGRHETFPALESESLTALGILTRIFCGQDPGKSAMIKRGVELLRKKPPVWDEKAGRIDMYYWYFGTLALFQVGGEPWLGWNEALPAAVLDRQRTDGNFAGSWDPKGAWGEAGGRIYSTALMTLSLEIRYRYGRVFQPK